MIGFQIIYWFVLVLAVSSESFSVASEGLRNYNQNAVNSESGRHPSIDYEVESEQKVDESKDGLLDLLSYVIMGINSENDHGLQLNQKKEFLCSHVLKSQRPFNPKTSKSSLYIQWCKIADFHGKIT